MLSISIAIDAMGGDAGPAVTVPAVLSAMRRHPQVCFILVGDEAVLTEHLTEHSVSSERLQIQHASQVVAMDDNLHAALRLKRDSSMRVAVGLVKQRRAKACVSAGNTGALMAVSRLMLRTLPGVDRPAIMASLPTKSDGVVYLLDLGANVDCHSEHLFQFALMGSVAVSGLTGAKRPRVALLNIGEEHNKGNDTIKHAAQMLSNHAEINYIGFIEADALYDDRADVVVCDGFVGNVLLKTIEGTAKTVACFFKQSFTRHWGRKFTALLACRSLREIKACLNTDKRNGALLLGLRGIVVKSHGGANQAAFGHAIDLAIKEADYDTPQKIDAWVTRQLDESGEV